MVIRSDGSKAWRNNNPGNMVYNSRDLPYVMERLDPAGGKAVFPDEPAGRQALIALLKTADYQKLSVSDLPYP